MEPKTFHDSIKPLVYANCCAGIGALRHPNQNDTTYFFMKLYTLTINFVQCVMIYVTFSSIAQVNTNSENISSMNLMMYHTLVYTNSCFMIIAPFLLWHRRKLLRDCLRRMSILDETFEAVLGVPNEYRKEFIRLNCQVVIICLVVCLIAIYGTVINSELELRMNIRILFKFLSITCTLHHPIMVVLLMDVNFCTCLRYLGRKFRGINHSLLEMAENSSTSSSSERMFISSHRIRQMGLRKETKDTDSEAECVINEKHRLRKIRQAHLELCQLSRKINIVFGIQNLLSMGISFAVITGLSYTIYSTFSRENFTRGKFEAVIPSAFWIAIYAFKLWMVNHSCWSISNEAAKTGVVIYELIDLKVDKELQKVIQEFGLQIIQNPVRFSACECFPLDYTFVQGVIGSITTYLVILIQMNDSPTSNATVTNNISKVTAN